MTCKELFFEADEMDASEFDDHQELEAHQCMRRALLVAAMIDEGWVVGQNREEELPNTGAALIDGDGEVVQEYEWPGTVADMPAEIYEELKGRLK